jgi:hypothetical protein
MKKEVSKSLRDMNIDEIIYIYSGLFNGIICKNFTDQKFVEYKNKYNKFIKYKELGYNSPTAMGRDKIAYGRTIIYGWLIEELVAELFRSNFLVKSVNYCGQDKEHDFVYCDISKNIKISGKKSSDPDLQVVLKNSEVFFLEIKTAVKNIFTFKMGGLKSLYKTSAEHETPCIIFMLDLDKGLYNIVNLNYFENKSPFANQNLEGQLCYNLPTPDKKLNELLIDNLDFYLDKNFLSYNYIKKYRLLKIAKNSKNKKIIKIIENKMKIENIELELKNFHDEIKIIEEIDKDVLKSWDEIEQILKNNLNG